MKPIRTPGSSSASSFRFENLEKRWLLASVVPDTTFDGDGVAKTNFGGSYEWASHMAIQPDGKIVVVGNGNNATFAAARYNTNGSLDSTFGSGGKMMIPGSYGWVYKMALQKDGKILISGNIWDAAADREYVALYRLNANGTPDATWGTNGLVKFNEPIPGEGRAVLVQPADQKVILLGQDANDHWRLIRYNTNGTLDTSFGGGDGVVTKDWGPAFSLLFGATLQPDGKIVAAGYTEADVFSEAIAIVARFNANGTVDTTFGTGTGIADGSTSFDFSPGGSSPTFNYLYDVQIMTDGRIVVGGEGLARLTSGGQLDTTFSGDGRLLFGDYTNDVRDVHVYSDGRILVAGEQWWPDRRIDIKLQRYLANGSLDTSFNNTGTLIKDFSGNVDDELVMAMAIDAAGRIVVGGSRDRDGDFLVARFVEGATAPGSISGTMYNDLDGDGIKDTGEGGLAGWTVYIDADKDNLLDAGERTATTNASGVYLFTGMPAPGTYRVAQVLKSGWRRTYPTLAYHDVAVTPGQGSNNRNFGNTTNVAISGTVWNDLDGDGIRESGEPVLGNHRVYVDLDKDGVFDATEPSALTNGSGFYKIGSLPAGTYRVRHVRPLSGYRYSTPPSGYYDRTLAAGASTQANFGITQKILISGKVFNDLDGDHVRDTNEAGLGGWRVFIDANSNGLWDSTEKSVLTNSAGDWSFKDLSAGTYRVRVVQQTGWTRTTPSIGYHTVTLGSGGSSTGKLFGERRIA